MSPTHAAAVDPTAHGTAKGWPTVEWRLFNALAAWAPTLVAESMLPGVAVELLLLGVLMVAPRVAWAGARGSLALLTIALPWSIAASFGLPLPSAEGAGLVAGSIWAFAYLAGGILSWAGRLSPRPWLERDTGSTPGAELRPDAG